MVFLLHGDPDVHNETFGDPDRYKVGWQGSSEEAILPAPWVCNDPVTSLLQSKSPVQPQTHQASLISNILIRLLNTHLCLKCEIFLFIL